MGRPGGPWQTFSPCHHRHRLIQARVASLRRPQRRDDGKVAVAYSNQRKSSRIVVGCIEHVGFHRYLQRATGTLGEIERTATRPEPVIIGFSAATLRLSPLPVLAADERAAAAGHPGELPRRCGNRMHLVWIGSSFNLFSLTGIGVSHRTLSSGSRGPNLSVMSGLLSFW
jgi:hypothetical protein